MVIIALFSFSSVFALSCADQLEFNNLVCGGAPDSVLGLGAVEVCNHCYPCGADDGVCPEDFYTSIDGRGSCRFCPDPDCLVGVEGIVELSAGDNIPIGGAQVVAIYDGEEEDIAITDSNGSFSARVRTGLIDFFVRYEDFDSRVISQDINRIDPTAVQRVDFVDDFGLEPGTCSNSCTSVTGNRCKASCDGINGCQFENFSVANLCDDKLVGTRVFLENGNYIECCAGNTEISPEETRIQAQPSFADQSIAGAQDRGAGNDLVTFTQRTRSNGERVNLQVVVWNSVTD
jgi:hypothetical protein